MLWQVAHANLLQIDFLPAGGAHGAILAQVVLAAIVLKEHFIAIQAL
jgi:hypothetical protein